MPAPCRPSLASIALIAAAGAMALGPRIVRAQCERIPSGTRIIASDATTGAYFGHSLAMGGDTVIVGAPRAITNGSTHDGEAYIFVNAGGSWIQQARFSGPPRTMSDFGTGVGFWGSTVMIGEPTAGAAYFSNRSGTAWSAPVALTRTEVLSNDQFGSAIAMGSVGTRNTAIIGAPGYGGSVSTGGAAFVMNFNTLAAGGWVESGFLTASDRANGDDFGLSVAISGKTAVVGAPGSSNLAGAVYVFTSNQFAGAWTQQAKITPADLLSGDKFGFSVAIAGDTIVVGAPTAAIVNNGPRSGRVYVFTRSGTVWTQQAELAAPIPAGFLGASVAISGDRLVAGGEYGTPGTQPSTGYAALYARPAGSGIAGTWAYEDLFFPSDATTNDDVGSAVAIIGTRIVVGAQAQMSVSGSGAAYIVQITNPCPPDFDCSGNLVLADIFAFLNAWFTGSATADFDGVNGLQVADIFAFLNAWFAGCP